MDSPSENCAQPAMEKENNNGARQVGARRKKWLVSSIATAAVILCFLLTGWFLVLPGFIEKRLAEELTKLGFDRVEVQGVRVGLTEAEISNLRLGGKDPIVIRYLVAKFSLSQILKGHLENVTINGMEFKIQVTGSGIHLPQLQNLTLPESRKPNEPIPVNKIQIQSAKAKLQDHNGLNHDIPIEATIRQGRHKTLEVEFSSGESLSAGGRLLLDKGTVCISDGALILNSSKLPIPGLENPLERVSLSLFFEAEKGTKETILNLQPGSKLSAKLKRFSLANDFESTGIELKLNTIHAVKMNFADGKFILTESPDFIRGNVKADHVVWIDEDSKITARELKTTISASSRNLSLALQKEAKLEWLPSDGFLEKQGIKAENTAVNLDELLFPAQLQLNRNGSWNALVPQAHFRLSSEAITIKESGLTCDAIKAGFNLKTDISNDHLSMKLLSPANVIMGKILHKTFHDAQPLEVSSTEWRLSPVHARPVISKTSNGDPQFMVRISSDKTALKQGDWNLQAEPLSVLLEKTAKTKKLSEWNDTRLVFSPDNEWLRGNGVEAQSVKLTIDQIPMIQMPESNQIGKWALAQSNVQVTGEAKSIKLPENGIEIDYLKIPTQLEIAFDERGLDLDLEKDAIMEVQGARYRNGKKIFRVLSDRWKLEKKSAAPILHLDTTNSEFDFNGRLAASEISVKGNDFSLNPLSAIQIPFSIKRDKINFQLNCHSSTTLVATLDGQVSPGQQRYNLSLPPGPNLGKVLRGLMPGLKGVGIPNQLGANLSVSSNQKTGPIWNIRASNILVGSRKLPVIDGEADFTESADCFSAVSELFKGLFVRLDGNITKQQQTYKLKIPPTPIPGKSALKKLLPEMDTFEIGGTLGLETDIIKSSNTITSTSEILLENCSISSSKHSAKVEGLSGNIRLNGIGPFSTQDAQHLSLDLLKYGGLELINGAITFELKPHEILFKEAKWSLKQDEKGVFRATNFSLSENKPIQTVLEVQDLDLGLWLGLLTDGKVLASGKLHGRIPVFLHNKDDKIPVRLGDGAFLKSSKPGKFQFKSAKWASDWLDSVDPRFKSDPTLMELRDSLVEALQDFSYSTIKLDYNEGTDSMRVLVKGEGKTQKGRVVKFDPTINIKPVASWVNEVYTELVLIENLISRDLNGLFDD